MNRAWETVNLGDICRITSSKRIFAKEYRTSGVPFYGEKKLLRNIMGVRFQTSYIYPRNDMKK